MRKTIKSTKPKTKREYTRKSKLRTERTERTPIYSSEFDHLKWETAGALGNVSTDIQSILARVTELEQAHHGLDGIVSELTHRLDKTDHNVKAIFLRMKDLE